jgi:transketolase
MGENTNYFKSDDKKLRFVPISEIRRIRVSVKEPVALVTVLADIVRLNTLYMIMRAGSGHIGSSFSSADIITWLWTQEMFNPNEFGATEFDTYFSSKGHDVPALYSLLIALEKLPFEKIHTLRRFEGLPGHPDVGTPYVAANTGALGMGISKARGMAIANKRLGKRGNFYVMTGDGELQEGAFWESLQPTANGKFSEITAIIDHNKIQSDTWVKDVSDLGNLENKLKAFGWEVARVSGHDAAALKNVFAKFKNINDKPKIVIADTVKGKGVSFMEKMGDDGYYKFHSGAPSPENYALALEEIVRRINASLSDLNLTPLTLESIEPLPKKLPANPQKLVAAYADELLKMARERKDLVALDADLILDTGLIPFKKELPDQFVECGIAEQDMVSVAGGLALRGALPVAHSFACFLTTRPNEQIYNNASEGKKIIYAGSLAGLLPSLPGHSHQSVRDISAIGGMPNMVMIQPANELEARLAIRWAVAESKESVYIRLVSIPCEIPFDLPAGYILKPERGVYVREGSDALIIAYGPVMLGEAFKAAEMLKEKGKSAAVLNLPWLNRVDGEWLAGEAKKYKHVFTLDDHYVNLGQGMQIAAELARHGVGARVTSLGLTEIPVCGQNSEALAYHKLDAISIIEIVLQKLK